MRAVVHDKVPRPIVAPWIWSTHTDLSENDDHVLELCCLQPKIQIRMDSGLRAEQRVYCPAAGQAHIDSTVTEYSQQLDGGVGIHHMVKHRLQPTEWLLVGTREFTTDTERATRSTASRRMPDAYDGASALSRSWR